MPEDPHVEETFQYLCEKLERRGVAYMHLVYQLMPRGNMDESAFKETRLGDAFVRQVRDAFRHTLIWCGGFTKSTAQVALETGWTDLIAFGRPFVGNPDLVARLKNDWPVVEADPSTFYTRNGEKGYTDFPKYQPSPR